MRIFKTVFTALAVALLTDCSALIPSSGQTLESSASSPSIDKDAALSILEDVMEGNPVSEEQIQVLVATNRLTEPEIRELIAMKEEAHDLTAKRDKAAKKRLEEIGQPVRLGVLDILKYLLEGKPVSEEQIQVLVANKILPEPQIRKLIALKNFFIAQTAKRDKDAENRLKEIGQRIVELMNKASSI
jgi:hypothetical protein